MFFQSRSLDFGILLGGSAFGHHDQVMMAASQVPQSLRHSGDDRHRVLRDSQSKSADSFPQLMGERFHAQALEGVAKRIPEAVQPVAMGLNGFPLDFVQALANLLRRELAV